MRYLGQSDISILGTPWNELINVIKTATTLHHQNDFVQPIKPYLRYENLKNRIIAMPAYIGGDIGTAGIKWIASFPANIEKGIPRAHSVTILNDRDTGVPLCLINTTRVSAIRTAAVSGMFITEIHSRMPPLEKVDIGIIGFGPIGQSHLDMIKSLLGTRVHRIRIFDLKRPSQNVLEMYKDDPIEFVNRWQDAFNDADVFMTCTVSSERYINEKPKQGSLHLNVSLRDYFPDMRKFMTHIIVDDWDEICRENTDIERMHVQSGLTRNDTISLSELSNLSVQLKTHDVSMFNPMGLAIYDIAIARYYYDQSVIKNVGIELY